MRFCADRFRAGAATLHEYEIEAELLHEFRRRGAAGPAYTSIVAAGANACVLHYTAGDATGGDALLKPGELCLILVDQVQEAIAHIAAKVAATQ